MNSCALGARCFSSVPTALRTPKQLPVSGRPAPPARVVVVRAEDDDTPEELKLASPPQLAARPTLSARPARAHTTHVPVSVLPAVVAVLGTGLAQDGPDAFCA